MTGTLALMLSLAAFVPSEPPVSYWASDWSAQEQRRLELAKAEEGAVAQRLDRILWELAAIEAAEPADTTWAAYWAGTYSGMWRGVYIEVAVAPASGATLARGGQLMQYCSGHMGGTPLLADHGDLSDASASGFSVDWVTPTEIHRLPGFCRLCFVEINGEPALIPDSAMLGTVNALNAGSRYIDCLRRAPVRTRTSPSFDPRGLEVEVKSIELREPWKSRLLDRRVEFTVKSVTPGVRLDPAGPEGWGQTEHLFRVELDGGTDRGAFVGMTIPFQGRTASGQLEITHVDATTCSGVLTIGTPAGKVATPPDVGAVLALPGLTGNK